jgi:cystathionine beta-lyase
MQYDFDRIIDRTHNHAAKYDERMKKFGTEDVIPLWIADMDFMHRPARSSTLSRPGPRRASGATPPGRRAILPPSADWQKRRNGWDIDRSLMSFSLGVVQTISACVKQFHPRGRHRADPDAGVFRVLRHG